MFCIFEIVVLPIFKGKNLLPRELASLSILNLFPYEFVTLRIFCKLCLQNKLFTHFRTLYKE